MALGYEVDDAVAVITLDRPDVLNAFDDDLGTATLAAVAEASSDDSVRCIVITGSGRGFSAGEDLGALQEGYRAGSVPELGSTLVERYNPLIRAIRNAPKPVVAAVNGVAAGAGASVALACDFRIASEHAKLVIAFVKVGLVPDSGALWFLTRMIGESRTWALAATGDPVGADRCLELGIFHEVHAADVFEKEWRARAAMIAEGPTVSYALTKSLLHQAAEVTLDDQLEAEVLGQAKAGRSADHLEGVQAFLEKRAPKFGGT
ncbi:MAG: 2-(1,2-epoxy,2-dihydrophenyl)acetyl-CoA isomerase [Actinomycetota bacterium]|nr:2-(1,2-epoxy,2-dihydrophenyl)acetyl-CoA isomerase [Actinomycetota bacterium]